MCRCLTGRVIADRPRASRSLKPLLLKKANIFEDHCLEHFQECIRRPTTDTDWTKGCDDAKTARRLSAAGSPRRFIVSLDRSASTVTARRPPLGP